MLTNKDCIFITYANSFQEKGKLPLITLKEVSDLFLSNFSIIHILPPFESTSDGGFSVSNFLKINPSFGDWKDVSAISKSKQVMIDLVLNHTSSKHEWFQKAISGEKKYQNYYLCYRDIPDHKNVFRPRVSPLFSKFNGMYYWTTFSKDQIDLNFDNNKVEKEVFKIIEFYIKKGISIFRLDAIAYMYKDLSTNCVDLSKVHKFISKVKMKYSKQIFISEVNLSDDIITKYSKKTLVYNFPLGGLIYYSFKTNNYSPLLRYMRSMKGNGINFLACHDGIGLTPLKKYLTKDQINFLVKDSKKKGAVGYGNNGPYELNINYVDAIGNTKKFICAHAILICLKGIPAIYYSSLFGAKGSKIFPKSYPRTLNRKPISKNKLNKLSSDQLRILESINELLEFRKSNTAFHPRGTQTISFKRNILCVTRTYRSNTYNCYFNLGKSTKFQGKPFGAFDYYFEKQ